MENEKKDTENDFVEGLCQILGGMNALTSRYVVTVWS